MVATTALIATTVALDTLAAQATRVHGAWMDHLLNGFWASGIFWLLFGAGLLGFVAVTFWPKDHRASKVRQAEEDALEILKRRHARGEIDSQEFREKMRGLA
jgi:uncharacterized membrane protein